MTKAQTRLLNTLIEELKSAKSQYEIEIAMRYFWHTWFAIEQEDNKNEIK